MKKTISTLILAVIISVGFTACNKEDGPIENQGPGITIVEPSSANNPFISGQSMRIRVDFTDDEELHEMEVSVVRQHDGAEVFNRFTHNHSTLAIIMVDTVLTTAMHSNFVVTARATDHDGKMTTATETIYMHPM